MGLFINHNEHPDVYKNNRSLNEPNQGLAKQDFLTKLMNEQHQANAVLQQTLAELGLRYLQQEETKVKQWNQLDTQLNELSYRLKGNEEATQQLGLQMNAQLELQKEAAEKMTNQVHFQSGVLQRLDNQDALIDKISRQLNHIRSIIFERTNYLAAKIDDGYKVTSSYVYKLMTSSDQPLTFFLMNHKKEENQNQSD